MSRTSSIELPSRPNLEFEQRLWQEGYRIIAGLDEAGRGAWAGPVVAAAVVLPNDPRVSDLLSGVRDSKRMTPGSVSAGVDAFSLLLLPGLWLPQPMKKSI